MNTFPYKWRSYPNATAVSGEGTTIVFVHEKLGNDVFGDGTRTNPYQTPDRAYLGRSTKPTEIVGVGRFCSNMASGNHNCTIRGDYFGALVFDGADLYVLYGFRHRDIIIINTGIGAYDLSVWTGSVLLAGVGSADSSAVGFAYHVYGVAGSSVLIDNSSLYYGCIGGTSAVKYVGFSRPKVGYYPIWLGRYSNHVPTHNTIYGCRIKDRMQNINTSAGVAFASSIFANFDMFADEIGATFTQCLFAADCGWYYRDVSADLKDAVLNTQPILQVVPMQVESMTESDEVFNVTLNDETRKHTRGSITEDVHTGTMVVKYTVEQLIDGEYPMQTAIRLLYEAGRSAYKPNFVKCVFTTDTSDEIFNNAEKQDFTLKLDGSGVISQYSYYGAYPPSRNIPIYSADANGGNGSAGIPGTWDERTCDGLICVENNEICLDENSPATEGSIMSKIVQIDPSKETISAVYSLYASKFSDYGCALWKPELLETEEIEGVQVVKQYKAGDILPLGQYKVQGAVIYQGNNLENHSNLVVSEENTTFADDNVTSTLIHFINANVNDVVYIRTTPIVYVKIKQGAGLQRKGVYLNIGQDTITYRNRPIAPGESFTAENSTDDFIASNPNYEIGILFDDTRVPSAEWVPYQLYGQAFVCKESGTIKLDDNGVPISSGNHLAWIPTANGGYASNRRSTIRNRYIQFKFEVQCIYDHVA